MAGPLTVITFPAPERLLNLNDRLHWTVQRRRARAWRDAAHWAAVAALGIERRRPACVVAISLPVKDRRKRDPHNLFPTVKPIVDGLVDAGIWPDDTPEWVTTVEPALEVADVVTVTLTERSAT